MQQQQDHFSKYCRGSKFVKVHINYVWLGLKMKWKWRGRLMKGAQFVCLHFYISIPEVWILNESTGNIKPRFYCCPALWVPHPLCQLLSKLSVNISHLSLLLSPLNLLSLLPLLFQIQISLFCPTSINIFCLIAKKNPTRNISSYV